MSKKKRHASKSGCPIAHALDVIGDRWSLIVLRDLMFLGKHEFGEFLNGEEKIATNILTDRLKKLLEAEMIDSVPHPDSKLKKLYFLTEKGISFVPVMLKIVMWSINHSPDLPSHPRIDYVKANPKKYEKEVLAAVKKWNKENVS